MGMERIYTCDICKKEKGASELKGFWFETHENDPLFIEPEKTNNIHICNPCRNQLARALTQEALDYTH
jgi:hypothetical protein